MVFWGFFFVCFFNVYVLDLCLCVCNIRGCASRSPAANQNQLGRVKAICDLASLASEVYCKIIIINNTNLINFYSFHFSCQCVIKHGFLKIRCLWTCTEIHTNNEIHMKYTNTHETMFTLKLAIEARILLISTHAILRLSYHTAEPGAQIIKQNRRGSFHSVNMARVAV